MYKTAVDALNPSPFSCQKYMLQVALCNSCPSTSKSLAPYMLPRRSLDEHQHLNQGNVLVGAEDDPEDESCSVDADTNIFGHVMRFLHRGNFPAICNKVQRDDYAGYAVALKQAQGCGNEDPNTWTDSRRCA